ncbi:hypothetical protein DL98DRAFT_648024 [Cadophora sp. DSE1049]|nr:hypothetical protein DL98DRAFT_648024 [Cadophora sp. DSE1049]
MSTRQDSPSPRWVLNLRVIYSVLLISRVGSLSAEAVFTAAAKRFYDELPEGEKDSFQRLDNFTDMIDSIEQQIRSNNSPRTARLLNACKKIDQFGKSMEPFFKIVGIFVSSHPEWTALFWGAIRLVFQLSSHFAGFFEKLAMMFEEFRRKIPNYHTHFRLIETRIRESEAKVEAESEWHETHACLFKALALVYTDMLQFCHDACRLFSRKRRGVRYKAVVIWDLFWTPFDERFSETLARLERHQQDFDSSLKVVYSREMMNHLTEMDRERQNNAEHRALHKAEHEAAASQAIEFKLQALKRWISVPNWTGPFEAARSKRIEDTGLWILEQPQYEVWLTQTVPYPTQGSIFAKNVLVVAAKPGYGKTILSTRIVEDLQQRVLLQRRGPDPTGPPSNACMAFFYFDQQQADKFSRSTAFKAICAQLIHGQKDDQTAIDVASLMMTDGGGGQVFASDQAVEELVGTYLRQLDSSYLLFDALDECSDWDEFLVSLRRMAEHTSCKIIIITRPHLSISSIIGQQPFRLDLEQNLNLVEIESIIRPTMMSLTTSGKLGSKYNLTNIDGVIRSLTKRADSIALWAVLMMKYIQSSFLTSHERALIIVEDIPFRGLDKLYSRIVQDIENRVPSAHQYKVHRIFEWLVAAQHSWTAAMLEIAVGVQPDRAANEDDLIYNFKEYVLELCGPLVEVRPDDRVRFIHLSVAEYLTNSVDSATVSSLSVDLSTAHRSTACLCLRYLLNETPREALSGDPSRRAERPRIASRYRLLPYVVQHWPTHASRGRLGNPTNFAKLSENKWFSELIQLLLRLAKDKLSVALWIEASWLFEIPPVLLGIPSQLKLVAAMIEPGDGQSLADTCNTLQDFENYLIGINKQWGKILREDPQEIWLPSINGFSAGKFGLGTNAAHVTSLSSHGDENSKAIVSQVSNDGMKLGVIRVWPSENVKRHGIKPCHAGSFAHLSTIPGQPSQEQSNWAVAYEIWSLERMCVIQTLRFEIPPDQILEGPKTPDQRKLDQEYRFPVALSPSLRMAFIMGVIVQVQISDDSPSHNFEQQHLFDPHCPYSDVDPQLLERLHTPQYMRRHNFESSSTRPRGPNSDHPPPHHEWLRCCFSPSESYMTVLKGDGPPGPSRLFSSWILEIYHNVSLNLAPNYQLIARSGVRMNPKASHPLLFHPTRPVVVLCLMSITVIWRFTLEDNSFITIYEYPLDHMKFSNCGDFLQGVRLGYPRIGEPVFLHLARRFTLVPLIMANDPKHHDSSTALTKTVSSQTNVMTSGDRNWSIASRGGAGPSIPEFSDFQGQLQVTALSQDNDAGAVMLQTMRADGKMIEETITRLPQSSTLEKSYSSLVPASSHKNIRLVLNMAIQDTYSVNEAVDFQLPAVVDREEASIPKMVYSFQPRLEAGPAQDKRRIEHLGDVSPVKRKRPPRRRKDVDARDQV